jgi:hypothetical protein
MTVNVESLEAQILAHRKILAEIVAHGGDALREALNARVEMHDAEEDPGVMSGSGFAIEAGIGLEIRAVLDAARAFAARRD